MLSLSIEYESLGVRSGHCEHCEELECVQRVHLFGAHRVFRSAGERVGHLQLESDRQSGGHCARARHNFLRELQSTPLHCGHRTRCDYLPIPPARTPSPASHRGSREGQPGRGLVGRWRRERPANATEEAVSEALTLVDLRAGGPRAMDRRQASREQQRRGGQLTLTSNLNLGSVLRNLWIFTRRYLGLGDINNEVKSLLR